MCGLVGIAGDLALRDEDTMQRLFMFDYFRGKDSTGLAAIRDNLEACYVAKLAAGPVDLFGYQKFKNALNGAASKVFLGHNRAATKGIVNNVNAHPFHHKHIVGAHNGTLEDGCTKLLEDMLGDYFGTDSEALIAAIAEFGVENVIPVIEKGKDMGKGAWALTWYDQKEGTLNFLRNEHRPLWYAWTDDFKRLFWASEYWMIDAAAHAGFYKLYCSPEGYRFFKVPDDTLYSIKVEDIKKGSDKLPKFKSKTLKGKEPAPVVSTYAPFGERKKTDIILGLPPLTPAGGTMVQASGTTSKKTSGQGPTAAPSLTTCINLEGHEGDPLAGYMQEIEFCLVTQNECKWCGDRIDFGQPGIRYYERTNEILCAKCDGHDADRFDTDPIPQSRIYLSPERMKAFL